MSSRSVRRDLRRGPADDDDVELLSSRLRERVYVTFTGLAVLLTLAVHADVEPGEAAATLAITTLGTVVAAFAAEVVSHLAVHAALPDTTERRRMAQVSLGAFSVATPPLLLLAGAGLEWWETQTALNWGVGALVASLVLIGWLGLRRARVTVLQRLVTMAALVLLGMVVVGLKLLAH